jgi:hypothetical protein
MHSKQAIIRPSLLNIPNDSSTKIIAMKAVRPAM